MTPLPFVLGAAAGALASLAVPRWLRSRRPSPTRVDTPLDQVNDAFHEHYARVREPTALDVPVFLVMGDELIVHHRGERRVHSFAPRIFHVIKSGAHGPVALYVALHRLGDAPVDAPTRARLAALREALDRSHRSLAQEHEETAAVEHVRAILDASRALLDRVLTASRVASDQLAAFAADLGPRLLALTDDAARVQLAALDTHVRRALTPLTPDEQRSFQVVVTGDHQARARSLGMQYFQKLLGESAGEERRVTYGEGVTSEEDALALVGTRRLDRAIATAFFGDSRRLQQDVLGDATARQLAEWKFPTIER